MTAPYKGTLVQCLDRLRQSPISNINTFIDFVRSTNEEFATKTAWRWLMLDEEPSGEYWLRAAIFFRFNDWEVAELLSISEEALGLADLWGMDIMKPAEIKDELGYKSATNGGLLRLIYGGKFMSGQGKLMKMLLAQKEEAIALRRQKLKEKYPIVLDAEVSTGPSSHGDAVVILAQLLREAAPLAKAMNDDESAGADKRRHRLRELVGSEYGQLAVDLSQMKSAQTRLQARQGGRIR